MSAQRYVVITLEDAKRIASMLDGADPGTHAAHLADRFVRETGADVQEIVDALTGLETCAACNIEAQEASCVRLDANRQGRRLRRLLERARGER